MEINISQKKVTKIKAAAPFCSLGDIVEQLLVGTPLSPPVRGWRDVNFFLKLKFNKFKNLRNLT